MLRLLCAAALVLAPVLALLPAATALDAPCAVDAAPSPALACAWGTDAPLRVGAGVLADARSLDDASACATMRVGAGNVPVCAAVTRGRATCVVLIAGDAHPLSATCLA